MDPQMVEPFRREKFEALTPDDAERYLRKAHTKWFRTEPPKKPNGGEIYFYDLKSMNYSSMDRARKHMRADGMRFASQGCKTLKNGLKKAHFWISNVDGTKNQGFQRHEYWFQKDQKYALVHYIGDNELSVPFPHGNSKHNTKNYNALKPCVKDSVLQLPSTMSTKEVYSTLASAGNDGVSQPRDRRFVKNARSIEAASHRVSHDAHYNIARWKRELVLGGQEFIRRYGEEDDYVIHILAGNLVESLQMHLKIYKSDQTIPVTLHYDTCFGVGDYYVTPILFRATIFKGNPLIPFGYYLHGKRGLQNHNEFLRKIMEYIPDLGSTKTNFVSDKEFNVDCFLPNSKQLYCWNHIRRDMRYWVTKHLKDAGSSDRNQIQEDLHEILKSPSLEEFRGRCDKVLTSETWLKYSKLIHYFNKHQKSDIESCAGLWILEEQGIMGLEGGTGLTNNASESANAVLKRFVHKKDVPIDVATYSLFLLSQYFGQELERSRYHNQGEWQLKAEYSTYVYGPDIPQPKWIAVIRPDDIVEKVLQEEKSGFALGSADSPQKKYVQSACATDINICEAERILEEGRITFVPQQKCFVVTGHDGSKKYTCTLDPLKCSCIATSTCCHLKAMLFSLNLEIDAYTGPKSITSIMRKERRGLRPGRKGPLPKTPATAPAVTCSSTDFEKTPTHGSTEQEWNRTEQYQTEPNRSVEPCSPTSILKATKRPDKQNLNSRTKKVKLNLDNILSPLHEEQSGFEGASLVDTLQALNNDIQMNGDNILSPLHEEESCFEGVSLVNSPQAPNSNNDMQMNGDNSQLATQMNSFSRNCNFDNYDGPMNNADKQLNSWLNKFHAAYPKKVPFGYILHPRQGKMFKLICGQMAIVETTGGQLFIVEYANKLDSTGNMVLTHPYPKLENQNEALFIAGASISDPSVNRVHVQYVPSQGTEDLGHELITLLFQMLLEERCISDTQFTDDQLLSAQVIDLITEPILPQNCPRRSTVSFNEQLYCTCKLPDICGDTAKSLGFNSPDYDQIKCATCSYWYHRVCEGVSIPTRSHKPWYCSTCLNSEYK